MKKKEYRVGNWKSYNKSLIKRGDITLWFDEETLKLWNSTKKTNKAGRPRTYGDEAIRCLLTIKALFRLPLRATQGFGMSLIRLLGLQHIQIPDYSTLCRRQGGLTVPTLSDVRGPIHLVFDSTGLKIFGDGEWQVRQHGVSKRRTWRKLHLALDEKSGQILASVLTTNDVGDGEVLPDLLAQVDSPIRQASGDGAYDSHVNYELLEKLGAKVTIPPREGAVISGNGFFSPLSTARNRNICLIKLIGKKRWKHLNGYHRRSLSEAAMMRFKRTFGANLSSRTFENQATEAFLKCNALNKMTMLGKPRSYKI